jgi:dolichyl-diphosphooligosaccharide--protein glycosyltransferase
MGLVKKVAMLVGTIAVIAVMGWLAYDYRMHAIRTYGLVIHEFDPWFNFRAAQYLADNGMERFFKWYDYMSWYPLGRPVGTTIYPGMQFASVGIWHVLNKIGWEWSLNDVCCYTPVWFGVLATMLLTTLTYVCTGGVKHALISGLIMAIIPGHLMRSVGGGYDNESVAISCLTLTFLMWMYSLAEKDGKKYSLVGLLTALAYTCMVNSWGGYIFVLNMIGLHAMLLAVTGRFTNKLYWSYTLWYVFGTLGAMQVPVVGLTPLRSLEQLMPMGVFFVLQLLQLCEQPQFLKLFQLDPENMTTLKKLNLYVKVFGAAGLVGSVVVSLLWPTGYFGPLSSRIRGLFVKHTRTGNPLVDSVAEHQPGSSESFYQFLHYTCYTSPIGFAIALFQSFIKPFFRPSSIDHKTDPMSFITVYAYVTYLFATKMNRLMLMMGPVSSILSGIALGYTLDFCLVEICGLYTSLVGGEATSTVKTSPSSSATSLSNQPATAANAAAAVAVRSKGKKSKASSASVSSSDSSSSSFSRTAVSEMLEKKWSEMNNLYFVKTLRLGLVAVILFGLYLRLPEFYVYTRRMSVGLSNPSLMFQAQLRDGSTVIIDDYREGYHWLRDNTPEDSRVMAWWDYGYQITGIANRTTIADGNTWNHEHIALLGRCLTSPEEKAHKMIKHLADYVLVWAGGGGDDLAKSPHMARIGNSVFEDICPGDPTCRHFGFTDRQMTPTPMMERSLLYRLTRNRLSPDVNVNSTLFREVFMSKYGKVRIYQVVGVSRKSKVWAADPANRICDAPGSWHCGGQYPPSLAGTLKKQKAFKQLEDFNVGQDEKSKKYQEEYMQKMNRGGSGGAGGPSGKKSPSEGRE